MLPFGQGEGRVVFGDGVFNVLAPSSVVKGGADIGDLGGPVITTLVILEEGVVTLALHGSDKVEEIIHCLRSAELGVVLAEFVAVAREEVAVVEADIRVGSAQSANISPEGGSTFGSIEGTFEVLSGHAAGISFEVSKIVDEARSDGLNRSHIFVKVNRESSGGGESLRDTKALCNNRDLLAVLSFGETS